MTIGTLPSLANASVNVLRAHGRGSDSKIYSFDLQMIPMIFGPLVAGVLRQRVQFAAAQVTLMSYFYNIFEEFRFRGIRLRPRVTNAQNVNVSAPFGYGKLWIDDAVLNTAAPTFTDAFSRPTVDVQLNVADTSNPKAQELQWVAADIEDLDWQSTRASPNSFIPFTVAYFAAPGANPGTNAGTQTSGTDGTSLISLMGAVRVEFRGLSTA